MFLTSKYHKIILSGLTLVLLFLIMAPAGLAVAETGSQKALGGLETTATGGFGADATKTATLSVTIGKVVGAALSFLGVVFFILMIYGGYMWMFSMGNEQTATKAKDVIIAAVIGLVIVLMAYAITSVVGNTLKPQV